MTAAMLQARLSTSTLRNIRRGSPRYGQDDRATGRKRGSVERDRPLEALRPSVKGRKAAALRASTGSRKTSKARPRKRKRKAAGPVFRAFCQRHRKICRRHARKIAMAIETMEAWDRQMIEARTLRIDQSSATPTIGTPAVGRDDAIELLEANLKEEKNADRLLSEIAESAVNQKAAA